MLFLINIPDIYLHLYLRTLILFIQTLAHLLTYLFDYPLLSE